MTGYKLSIETEPGSHGVRNSSLTSMVLGLDPAHLILREQTNLNYDLTTMNDPLTMFCAFRPKPELVVGTVLFGGFVFAAAANDVPYLTRAQFQAGWKMVLLSLLYEASVTANTMSNVQILHSIIQCCSNEPVLFVRSIRRSVSFF